MEFGVPAVDRLDLAPDVLAGRVAVVSGAGRGIGREAALACARLGAKVVLAEIAETGADTERTIREAGGAALFFRTDVASEDQVARLAEAARHAFGPPDILIHSATVCPVASVLDMDADTWDRAVAVNLRGAFLTSRALLPGMLSRGMGTIVHLISTDAMPRLSAYIAAKQGVLGFTRCLAAEVEGRGVHVTALVPGLVDTPGIREVAAHLAPEVGMSEREFLGISLHSAYRGIMPADHAGAAVAYLVARLAREYHGESVDGYTVLERAGFLKAPAGAVAAAPEVPATAPPSPAKPAGILEDAIALSRQLQACIAETDAEFNRLPVFFRPMARSGFKAKTGLSIQDWARTAADLVERLAAAGASGAAATPAEAAALRDRLSKLSRYYGGVPAEMARFTRDEAVLAEAHRVTQQRQALIEALTRALGALWG